jgi:hypothetical protein
MSVKNNKVWHWFLKELGTAMVMIVWSWGITTAYAISAYHNWRCEFKSCSWEGVLDTILCDKVCQLLPADLWFSPSTLVSSINKTDCHDIAEILLKVNSDFFF